MSMILTPTAVEPNEALVVALAWARSRGESGYQVAARAEVHPSELSRWANGHRLPNPEQAARLARALGQQTDVLFPVLFGKHEALAGTARASQKTGGDGASELRE
jgi:transcriptional regulator with XRE-family HTH domain